MADSAMKLAGHNRAGRPDGAAAEDSAPAGAGVKHLPHGGLTIDAATYVPYYLSNVHNGLSWGASRLYLKMFGVGLNEWRVLSALTNEPGIMANRIVEMVALNKSVVSRSARALEEAGHVRSELDGGRKLLYLTPSGVELHDRIIMIAMAREEALMDGFTVKDKQHLCALLRRMQLNLPKVDAQDRKALSAHAPESSPDL